MEQKSEVENKYGKVKTKRIIMKDMKNIYCTIYTFYYLILFFIMTIDIRYFLLPFSSVRSKPYQGPHRFVQN